MKSKLLALVCVSAMMFPGCMSTHEKRVQRLTQEVKERKLEVRKAYLDLQLKKLEEEYTSR